QYLPQVHANLRQEREGIRFFELDRHQECWWHRQVGMTGGACGVAVDIDGVGLPGGLGEEPQPRGVDRHRRLGQFPANDTGIYRHVQPTFWYSVTTAAPP